MAKAKFIIFSLALTVLVGEAPVQAQQTVGLFQNDPRAFDGYTLFSAPNGNYLIDIEGRLVNSWATNGRPPQLLENGRLVVGRGGVHEIDWDDTPVWDYDYSTQHHDYERLPNGNYLLITRESKTYDEAVAAGRDPALVEVAGGLRPLHVIEIAPTMPTGGTIVWEWHAWDHLIQDFDSSKANYDAAVADHPELIDINWAPNGSSSDWHHTNAIHYNPDLDQIILSIHAFSELWIIDHSTTTAEAAGHTAGNSGQGGDLLYRWGNPEAYRAGTAVDRTLFRQHDTQWIAPQLLGGDNILVFNNGGADRSYSSVDEIIPPVAGFNYFRAPGLPYGPAGTVWTYVAPVPTDFHAAIVSGTQRLPNGNTLINDGPHGTFFEVTPEGETVWKYVSPVANSGIVQQGDPIPPTPQGTANAVYRCYRYGPDYPGLDGQDLTPGDPIEIYTKPLPVPDGTAGTNPMTSSRLTGTGDRISIDWDAASCATQDYNLIFGSLADVSSYALQGSVCAIGGTGFYDWQGVPPGDLFFLIVGVEETGVYESSWGADDTGAERHGTAPSGMCGVTIKDSSMSCP